MFFLVRFKCCSLDSMVVGSVSCNGVVLCCSRLRLATSESSFVYFIGFGINKIVVVQKKNVGTKYSWLVQNITFYVPIILE